MEARIFASHTAFEQITAISAMKTHAGAGGAKGVPFTEESPFQAGVACQEAFFVDVHADLSSVPQGLPLIGAPPRVAVEIGDSIPTLRRQRHALTSSRHLAPLRQFFAARSDCHL